MEAEQQEYRGIYIMNICYILNNGVKIPQIGIGCWAQKKEDILNALSIGYRLIDAAAQYGNEQDIGEAIIESNISRSDVFLSTKLWTDDIRAGRIKEAFFASLQRLKTDYIDLYLIHWPAEGFEKAWIEMEELYKEGKIRAIGVCNFEMHHFQELQDYGATIKPVINQVESHPYFSNKNIINWCKNNDIFIQAWCPLGGPGSKELKNKTIISYSKKYCVTPAQVILKWHCQRGIIVIPKSSNKERMKENFRLQNIKLSNQEISIINAMDKNLRLGPHPDRFNF